jgi:hypothetical protein
MLAARGSLLFRALGRTPTGINGPRVATNYGRSYATEGDSSSSSSSSGSASGAPKSEASKGPAGDAKNKSQYTGKFVNSPTHDHHVLAWIFNDPAAAFSLLHNFPEFFKYYSIILNTAYNGFAVPNTPNKSFVAIR